MEKNKDFPQGSLPRCTIQKVLNKGNIKWEADPKIINGRDSWAHFPTPVDELPPEIRSVFTFPYHLFPGENDAEWFERKGMHKDYTLKLAWGRVNRFFEYLYSQPKDEIIVVEHQQLLEQYLFPPPWIQLVPNAIGYSFTMKWEVMLARV